MLSRSAFETMCEVCSIKVHVYSLRLNFYEAPKMNVASTGSRSFDISKRAVFKSFNLAHKSQGLTFFVTVDPGEGTTGRHN